MERKQKEGDRIAEKRWSTFFNTCIYLTIIMFIFTLLFNFIMGLGVFTDVTIPGGMQLGDDTSTITQEVTKSAEYPRGFVMDNLWGFALLGVGAGFFVAFLTRSMAAVGIYLFCFVFWSAYGNLINILAIEGFLTGTIWNFVLAYTAGMTFIFMAAVIGMTTGSG